MDSMPFNLGFHVKYILNLCCIFLQCAQVSVMQYFAILSKIIIAYCTQDLNQNNNEYKRQIKFQGKKKICTNYKSYAKIKRKLCNSIVRKEILHTNRQSKSRMIHGKNFFKQTITSTPQQNANLSQNSTGILCRWNGSQNTWVVHSLLLINKSGQSSSIIGKER